MHKISADEKYGEGSRKAGANILEYHIFYLVLKGLT